MPYRFEDFEAAVLSIDRDSPDFEQRAREQIESLVREVNASHAGRPADEVEAELRQRFTAHAITPLEPAFSNLVRVISEGGLPQ